MYLDECTDYKKNYLKHVQRSTVRKYLKYVFNT